MTKTAARRQAACRRYRQEFAAEARNVYARGGTMTDVGKALGCHERTATRWRVEHPEFGAAIEAGRREYQERELARRQQMMSAAAAGAKGTAAPDRRRVVIVLPDNGRD